MTWTYGINIFQNAFQGMSLFGNGAILTIILALFTMLLITRNVNKWQSLGLPMVLMFSTILKTIHGWWTALLIITSGTIWITTVIAPRMPKTIIANTREFAQDITGITKARTVRSYKTQLKSMERPITKKDLLRDIKIMTSKKGTTLSKESLSHKYKDLIKTEKKLRRIKTIKRTSKDVPIQLLKVKFKKEYNQMIQEGFNPSTIREKLRILYRGQRK